MGGVAAITFSFTNNITGSCEDCNGGTKIVFTIPSTTNVVTCVGETNQIDVAVTRGGVAVVDGQVKFEMVPASPVLGVFSNNVTTLNLDSAGKVHTYFLAQNAGVADIKATGQNLKDPTDHTTALDNISTNITVHSGKAQILKPVGDATFATNQPPGSFLQEPIPGTNPPEFRFCYDWQGVTPKSLGYYPIQLEGVVDPKAGDVWTNLTGIVTGKIAAPGSETTQFFPSNTTGNVTIRLDSRQGGQIICSSNRVLRIYQTHLDRDFANFDGKSNDPKILMPGDTPPFFKFVCHQSTRHAFAGQVEKDAKCDLWWEKDARLERISEVNVNPDTGLLIGPLPALQRGDIVGYYGSHTRVRHSATVLGTNGVTWGANNGWNAQGTDHRFLSKTVEQYLREHDQFAPGAKAKTAATLIEFVCIWRKK